MLSDLEFERLLTRESLDKHTRATNDVRVKRKLTAWLRSTGDVMLVLKYLQKDDIQEAVDDFAIFRLMNVAIDLLNIKGFRPIEGKEDKPDEWKAVIDKDNKELATDLDIARSYVLKDTLDTLKGLYGKENPMGIVGLLWGLDDHKEFKDRVTDDERRAINKVRAALTKYLEEGPPE